MKKNKAVLVFLLKAAVGMGLLSFFFSRLDLSQFFQTLSSARLSYVLLALFLYLIGKLLTAVRWTLLARPLGFSNPLKDFVVFYYIGMFFNLIGPSTLGGDVGRIFYLSRERSGSSEQGRPEAAAMALVSILADRAMGLAGLVWIAAGALLAFPNYASLVPELVRILTYLMALAPIVGWLLFPFCHRLLQKIAHPLVRKLDALGSAYWNRPAVLARAVGLSLIFHLIQIWIQVLVGRALAFDTPWSYACVFFPLVDIVAMLPVTISGIGFREGGFLFFLSKLDVGPEKAVACGTLWLVIVIVSGLVGGLVFLLRRNSASAPLAASVSQRPDRCEADS